MTDQLGDFGAAESLPAADVKAGSEPPTVYSSRAYPVRRPVEDSADFVVEVMASTLRKARSRLTRAMGDGLPWGEILLALASILIGAFLGALPADMAAHPWLAIIL